MDADLTWKPRNEWLSLGGESGYITNYTGEAVYIIARKSDHRVIRVGQTDEVFARLEDHDDSEEIIDAANGAPVVKWASTLFYDTDGIERYLFNRLNPEIGHRAPDVEPVTCNLPDDLNSLGQRLSNVSNLFEDEDDSDRGSALEKLLRNIHSE